MSRILTAAILTAALSLGACAGEPSPSESRAIDLPDPDLARVEASVREQLEELRGETLAVVQDADASAPELAAAIGGLGMAYHAYDLMPAAEACYREATGQAPEEFRWHFYLGFLHQTRGDLEAAGEDFDQALARRPDDLPTLLRLAEVRWDLSETATAEALYRRALELESRTAAAHRGLAQIAAVRGDFEQAVKRFERALELQPEASALHYPLAQAHRSLGDEERVRAHLELRGNTSVSFPDPLVQELDVLSVGAGLRLARGGVAAAEGRTGAALAEYRMAVEADPENVPARLNLAALLARTGDPEAAEAELAAGLERNPDNATLHDGLGSLMASRGALDEALGHFDRAVQLNPDSAAIQLRRGQALALAGQDTRAIEAYSRVLEIDPQNVDSRLGRAEAHLRRNRFDEGIADLRRLEQIDPGNALVRLRLGQALQIAGDSSGAHSSYQEALRLEPGPDDAAQAELGLGNLAVQAGDLSTASEHFRRALALDDSLFEAHFLLAGSLAFQGDAAGAATHYRRVLEAVPQHHQARIYLADALVAQGAWQEALAQYAEVVAVLPDDERARMGEIGALLALERHADALARLEAARRALPRSGALALAMARVLASCPDPTLRDGPRALELARALQAAQARPGHEEILAMALAEVGQFDEATRWQRQVIDAASGLGDPQLLARLRANLARYESGRPCCSGG